MFKIIIVTALVATFGSTPATAAQAPTLSLTAPISAVSGQAGALG